MPMRCFSVVHRQLQRLPPTQIRPHLRRRKTTPQIHVSPVDMRVYKEYQALKRNIGLAEWEILTLVHTSCFWKPSIVRLPDKC
jgi:hypothetical protein